MVRVKRCADVLILYCICQLLSMSLAASQFNWRADHDTHKLPGNVQHQHSQQQQQHKPQLQHIQANQHQVQHPQQLQQQQKQHHQSVTPSTIDNVYYMGVDANDAVNVAAVNVATDNKNKHDGVDIQARDYFTANRIEMPRLVEQSDNRFDDGHYEYSYTLSNGDTRYERAYWLPTGTEIILARKGYYSYPLPNNKYHTVFYTSDQNGFQQDSSDYSKSQPTLPRTVTVPEHPGSYHQHGVVQQPISVPTKPVVPGVPVVSHNNNNHVVSHVPHAGVGHWNSQGTYDNNHGVYKRVRRHVNEEKNVEESVDQHEPSFTTQRTQVQLPRTTKTPIVKSENLEQDQAHHTVEHSHREDITSHASHHKIPQQQGPVYAQPSNVQAYADLRDPTYNTQNYQNVPYGHRQQFPLGGTYSMPNQINAINRQTTPVGSQTELNAYNTVNSPVYGHRQTQPQQPQTTEQEQQILNQNALLNYLASRISAESTESYSNESNEVFLPGLLGSTYGTAGVPTHQVPAGLGQTRRRIRGNIPIWPYQQQQQHLYQRFY